MKKILLLAMSALVGLSSAFAQDNEAKRYAMGAVVNSEADLTSGTYFIRAHAGAGSGDKTMARGEAMVYDYNNPERAAGISSIYTWASGSTDQFSYVWKLEVIEDNLPPGATKGKVFTVQNLQTGAFWSVLGDNGPETSYPAKGNIRKDTYTNTFPDNPECHIPAQYQLVEVATGDYFGNQTECKRFFLQLTNAQFHNGTNYVYPFIHTNTTTPISLGYWGFNNATSTVVQFDFVKAEEITAVNITVNFPALNGVAIEPQTISAPLGKSPRDIIEAYANESMNCGGFTLTGISSTGGSTVVNEEGQEFTVEGKWDRQMVPGQVYRLRIRPATDACGTIRYMISTGAIETRRENKTATLNRLVPERLWYFTESGEGDNKTYTLHTIYDTSKAIKFTQKNGSWNNATASLEDEGTDLDFFGLNNGYFTMKINGTDNSWFNDFGGKGYLSIYSHDVSNIFNIEDGSRLLLYPLTDEDFAELANFATETEINAAKANPTVENVKPIIDAYNANNIEAALKRVSYITSKNLGTNPGQYSDPTGKFADAVNRLNQLAETPDADPEDVQKAIAAVNSLIEGMADNQITFNEMKPGFYRFRSKVNSSRYLSSIYGGQAAGKNAMAMTTDNARSNTVFYVQDNGTQTDDGLENYTVICFDDGLVLPNLNGNSWMPALQGTPTASSNVNFNYQDDGCFVIHVGYDNNGNHRHLHGGDNGSGTANAGGDSGNGYRWHIERVTELPVTFYNVMGLTGYTNDGWASVYSPVALEVPAEFTHTTIYTGNFDGKDYSGQTDINHILATKIASNAEGKVIIPANQPTLIFYDGEESPEENDNVNQSQMESRSHITYINFPIVEDYTPSETTEGNLKGSFLAVAKQTGKEYYTLHASHYNNFREYREYETGYSYIPGFKAYIENDPDGVTYYPIYLMNPNNMAPEYIADEDNNVNGFKYGKIEISEYDGEVSTNHHVVITLNDDHSDYKYSAECEVFYKHTPFPTEESGNEPTAVRRRANEENLEDGQESGFSKADKTSNEYSFDVEPGSVDYYVYHPATGAKSAVRTLDLYNGEVRPTGIVEVNAGTERAVECYDLQGRKLAAPAKGLNIINGKKLIVR